jgi:hypothetical protein
MLLLSSLQDLLALSHNLITLFSMALIGSDELQTTVAVLAVIPADK